MRNNPVQLFVADTGPLITLAVAGALDCLRFPSVPVVIPDAVFYEATLDAGRLGAQELIDWLNADPGQVEIAPTHVYRNFQIRLQADTRIRREGDMGERAATEVITAQGRLAQGALGVLLCEETNILRAITAPGKERIIPLSSMDFLKALEREGLIPSAEAILARSRDRGRVPSRAQYLPEHDPDIRDAVQAILSRANPQQSGS